MASVWFALFTFLSLPAVSSMLPKGLPSRFPGASHDVSRDLRNKMDMLRKLDDIRRKIVNQIGKTETPSSSGGITPRKTPPEVVTPTDKPLYKRMESAFIESEAPDNYTDENIVQFILNESNKVKEAEIEQVALKIRVQYRQKKVKKTVKRHLSPRNNKADGQMPDKDLKTSTNRRQKIEKRRKKKKLNIKLLVSKVTPEGTPGDVITTVELKLKKTKSFMISLPKEKIINILDSSHKLQLYLQCVDCTRKASLILVHKRKKRTRANSKRRRSRRHLSKRRPVLHVVSAVTLTKR